MHHKAMRVVGHIPHPRLKITLFRMDNKWAIKLEDGLLEQTYKFREQEGLTSVDDVKALVDAGFLARVEHLLAEMQALRDSLQPPGPSGPESFPEIL